MSICFWRTSITSQDKFSYDFIWHFHAFFCGTVSKFQVIILFSVKGFSNSTTHAWNIGKKRHHFLSFEQGT